MVTFKSKAFDRTCYKYCICQSCYKLVMISPKSDDAHFYSNHRKYESYYYHMIRSDDPPLPSLVFRPLLEFLCRGLGHYILQKPCSVMKWLSLTLSACYVSHVIECHHNNIMIIIVGVSAQYKRNNSLNYSNPSDTNILAKKVVTLLLIIVNCIKNTMNALHVTLELVFQQQ